MRINHFSGLKNLLVNLGCNWNGEQTCFILSPPLNVHHCDTIMGRVASQITSLTIVYSIIQVQIKENIKAPRHWPLCEEFTGTGEFPAQMARNAENVSIWLRHHASGPNRLHHVKSLRSRRWIEFRSFSNHCIKCEHYRNGSNIVVLWRKYLRFHGISHTEMHNASTQSCWQR